MTTETSAPAVDSTPAPANDTPRGLASMFAEAREAPESAEPATEPEPNSAPEAESAAPEQDPGNTTEEAEPADLPPIEPPRSWTQAEKERFQSLPRETQEYLHTREQEREREFRRSQNELADQRKAIAAERETAEKVRQQYEAQLPALMQTLQDAQQSSFADIRTVQDVEKLQAEDPFRFQAWQVQQMKLQAAHAENERVTREKSQAQQTEWATHVQKENELAAEHIPELADKVKGPALTQRVATELLPELGFSNSELNDLAAGKSKLSIYDHRVQRLLADALKLRDIKSAPKAVPQALPPVQRPGVSKPAANSNAGKIQALEKQLTNTSGYNQARIMAEIRQLRRAR